MDCWIRGANYAAIQQSIYPPILSPVSLSRFFSFFPAEMLCNAKAFGYFS
jgi:hypothetical protein